jgi:3-phosphoglycerate kinase
MKLRKLRSGMNFRGKKVLIRIDANVPIKNGKAVDGMHGRIARAAVDIDWLLQKGAKVIVLTHLGRPKGKRVSAYSVKPIADRISGLIGKKVIEAKAVLGKKVDKVVENMKEGEVVMLENLRFDPREKENAASFAAALAKLGDIYVNDAFGDSHREHASVDAITSELPSFAGPLLANETAVLHKAFSQVKHPFVLVMGGLKIKTKIPVIKNLSDTAESILIGGALATTFFVAKGLSVGKSIYDKEGVVIAKKLLKTNSKQLVLPIDVVAASSFRKDAKTRIASPDNVRSSERIVDIGPETRKMFAEKIAAAKTVVWNGPLGYCEIKEFCKGTEAVAKVVANQTGKAITIVGGGDTVPVVEYLKVADKFTLLSTGGGSLLEFLAGKELPGLQALRTDI